MKKQSLSITYIDNRQNPHRRQVKHYTNHGAYLRDLAKLMNLPGCHKYEETTTTVTIYPEQTVPDLFE